jgi:hypothetical protein
MRTIIKPALAVVLAVCAVIVGLVLIALRTPLASASVITGDEYVATSTYAALPQPVRTLKAGYGALAQVTITGANTGTMTLYDATTSNASLRTGQTATSSLTVLADFPASVAAGTYTFDARFSSGLLLSGSGLLATSTITYR